jgi:hypothetical protein
MAQQAQYSEAARGRKTAAEKVPLKSSAVKKAGAQGIAPEEHLQLISEAAYFNAEQHGFQDDRRCMTGRRW